MAAPSTPLARPTQQRRGHNSAPLRATFTDVLVDVLLPRNLATRPLSINSPGGRLPATPNARRQVGKVNSPSTPLGPYDGNSVRDKVRKWQQDGGGVVEQAEPVPVPPPSSSANKPAVEGVRPKSAEKTKKSDEPERAKAEKTANRSSAKAKLTGIDLTLWRETVGAAELLSTVPKRRVLSDAHWVKKKEQRPLLRVKTPPKLETSPEKIKSEPKHADKAAKTAKAVTPTKRSRIRGSGAAGEIGLDDQENPLRGSAEPRSGKSKTDRAAPRRMQAKMLEPGEDDVGVRSRSRSYSSTVLNEAYDDGSKIVQKRESASPPPPPPPPPPLLFGNRIEAWLSATPDPFVVNNNDEPPKVDAHPMQKAESTNGDRGRMEGLPQAEVDQVDMSPPASLTRRSATRKPKHDESPKLDGSEDQSVVTATEVDPSPPLSSLKRTRAKRVSRDLAGHERGPSVPRHEKPQMIESAFVRPAATTSRSWYPTIGVLQRPALALNPSTPSAAGTPQPSTIGSVETSSTKTDDVVRAEAISKTPSTPEPKIQEIPAANLLRSEVDINSGAHHHPAIPGEGAPSTVSSSPSRREARRAIFAGRIQSDFRPTTTTNGRLSSSPLKHEYAPSLESKTATTTESAEASDDGRDSPLEASSEGDGLELELEKDGKDGKDGKKHVPVPLPSTGGPDRYGRVSAQGWARGSPQGSICSAPNATLTPLDSASQAPYRSVPAPPLPLQAQQQAATWIFKAIATVSQWSAERRQYQLLHPNECSIVVTPGQVRVFEMTASHSMMCGPVANGDDQPCSPSPFPAEPDLGRPPQQQPVVVQDLTPHVPIFAGTGLDVHVQPPDRDVILLRSRSMKEARTLLLTMSHAAAINPTFLALQHARRSRADGDGEAEGPSPIDSSPSRSWFNWRRRSKRKAAAESAAGSASPASLSEPASSPSRRSRDPALKRLSASGGGGGRPFHTLISLPGLRSGATSTSIDSSSLGSDLAPTTTAGGRRPPPLLGPADFWIRLYQRVGADWVPLSTAACLLRVRPLPPPPMQADYAHPLHRDGAGTTGLEAKRIVVTGGSGHKAGGDSLLLDECLGETAFERQGRTGICVHILMGMVGPNGEEGQAAAFQAEAQAAYAFLLLGKMRY
ncbi:MAG: hypothetical protein M1826_001625 [Phylliscum demangeonii]|nr:MAG: hypothetical protein M1826_001625 [Phylliscum demangeonii]